jgi:protein-tyrosine-phosphatase
MKNILIICTANKTRSILAAEVASFLAHEAGKSGEYSFTSAGIAVMGNEVDRSALRALSEAGIEPAQASGAPTPLEGLNIGDYDEIHVMTRRQLTALCSFYGDMNIKDKAKILDIEDPYGKGENAYRDCIDRLRDYYEKLLNG